ncbi:MAG: hypothetical protein SOZ66_00470 [Candidatus Cryptobacteroides sp.]|nr:hypothetical protein [Candidatus Cryptobacteroides sp.]
MKKKILTYILIVLSFVVMAYAFVPQVLSGKIVNQSDISGHIGMSRETALYNEEHPSEPARWTGSMFSGMPTVSILNKTRGDLTQLLFDALQLGKRPASYLFISLLGAFLLMLAFGINPLIAVGGAIAITFCSFNFQIIQVGHNTKMLAIAFLPWVLAGVVFTYRKAIKHRRWLLSSLLGATLFALALSFQIKANHPQISWYLAVMILFYAVSELVYTLVSSERKKYLPRFFAASALLLAVGCVGIATNANKMLPLWEYSEYSIRGGSSSGTGDKGAGLEYATAWSYGWEELPNLVIPNYNGGSSSGAINPDKSKTCDLLRRAGQKNITQVSRNLPLYWGPQPFTAGPMYLGAVTFFLFLLSLMLCRGRDKWWMIGVSLLAILLALGSNLMGFTRFFYEYVPMYSKWRTVTMSLVILQFTLPVLGFLALDKLVREGTGKTYARKVLTAGAVSVGFCLVVATVQSLTGSFSGASDAGQPDILVDALAADRKSLLWKDTLRSVLFIAAAAGSLLIGLKIPSQAGKTFATHPEAGRSRRVSFAIILSLILLVDGFTAGKRYLNADDFVSPKDFRSQFALRPVDKMILEDKDPSYRVLDLSVNVFNDSHPSYWHKNIGGYSPAKLRIYQDYIENHLSAEINSIYSSLSGVSTVSQAQEALPEIPCLSALNCRYIIVGGDAAPIVNPAARGNAWFESPAPGDSISLTSYSPDVLQYSYESAGGGKAVFSEVYYPAGWEATLEDGTILDISLSDEVLRSVELPAGKHELTMRFAPASYSIGENVSRASSILLILLLISCVSIQLLKP